MKLSQILQIYPVTALGQFEFVSTIVDDETIYIEWNDSEDFESYRPEFLDQEIEITKQPGRFSVITKDGEKFAFTAYQPVDLYGTQEQPT